MQFFYVEKSIKKSKSCYLYVYLTSCRRAAATICPRPILPRGRRSALRRWADGNVAAVSHGQHVPRATPTAAAAWRGNTAVSKAAWWPWPFDLESGVRVTCDRGYLCASFSLPRPLWCRLRLDVRDRRQTSDAHHRYAPIRRGEGIISGR